MSDGDPHSALREIRAHFSHPATLVALGGTGAVLGLVGPFGTDGFLTLLPRLIYWLVLVTVSYGIGFLTGELIRPHLRGIAPMARIVAEGLVSGLGISAAVLAQNLVVFGHWPDLADLPGFVALVIAVSTIVTAVITTLSQHLTPPATSPVAAAPAPSLPPLLERLPLDKRGALVALSVEDHYVRVRTSAGEELILMRLSDAIREVGATEGAQVHRSHWAAFGQVTSVRREGDRAILTMRNGDEIPVSRANIDKIREAGLLPR